MARLLEEASARDALVRELTGKLAQDERVGFPRCSACARAGEVWRELEARLARPVFEVATLPPSLSGIRLVQRDELCAARGGRPDARRRAGRRGRDQRWAGRSGHHPADGAGDDATAPTRSCSRRAGSRPAGSEVDSYGEVSESVFGLPLLDTPPPGGPRFLPDYFAEHPLNRVGVAVDDRLRPISADGRPVYENLHAMRRDRRRRLPVARGAPATGSAWRDGIRCRRSDS